MRQSHAPSQEVQKIQTSRHELLRVTVYPAKFPSVHASARRRFFRWDTCTSSFFGGSTYLSFNQPAPGYIWHFQIVKRSINDPSTRSKTKCSDMHMVVHVGEWKKEDMPACLKVIKVKFTTVLGSRTWIQVPCLDQITFSVNHDITSAWICVFVYLTRGLLLTGVHLLVAAAFIWLRDYVMRGNGIIHSEPNAGGCPEDVGCLQFASEYPIAQDQ